MKKFFLFLLFIYGSAWTVFGETVSTSNSLLSIDLPPAWQAQTRADEPDLLLYAAKGAASVSLTALNQQLSDKYLQARARETIESVKRRGYGIMPAVYTVSTCSGAKFHHITYSDKSGVEVRTGFFTCGDTSYGFSSVGLSQSDFENIVFSIRKYGDSAPKRPVKKIAKSRPEAEPAAETPSALSEAEANLPSPVVSTYTVAVETQVSSSVVEASSAVATVAVLPVEEAVVLPQRRPLPLTFWLILLAVWKIIGLLFASRAKKIGWPKMSVPPKNLPPDYFFPFIVHQNFGMKTLQYSISTRTGEKLSAAYGRMHQWLMAFGFYGAAGVNAVWSAVALAGKEIVVFRFLYALPFGTVLINYPEMPFVVLFVVGLIFAIGADRRLKISDKGGETMLEMIPAASYIMVKDAQGKEIGRMRKIPMAGKGKVWSFEDVAGKQVFYIADDCPSFCGIRKFIGSCGGYLRARYGIYSGANRAGFVFNTAGMPDDFQVHLDFNHARLAHPVCIMSAILYIKADNLELAYPWL